MKCVPVLHAVLPTPPSPPSSAPSPCNAAHGWHRTEPVQAAPRSSCICFCGHRGMVCVCACACCVIRRAQPYPCTGKCEVEGMVGRDVGVGGKHGDCRGLHPPKPFTGSASLSWFSTLLIAHTLTAAQIRGGVQLWEGKGEGERKRENVYVEQMCAWCVWGVRARVCLWVEEEQESVWAWGREQRWTCVGGSWEEGWLLMFELLQKL